MKSKRIKQLLRQAERVIAMRPLFRDPAEFNAALFDYQDRGKLPTDQRQAKFIEDYDAMLAAMEASVPAVGDK